MVSDAVLMHETYFIQVTYALIYAGMNTVHSIYVLLCQVSFSLNNFHKVHLGMRIPMVMGPRVLSCILIPVQVISHQLLCKRPALASIYWVAGAHLTDIQLMHRANHFPHIFSTPCCLIKCRSYS
jgi:hypothetical protein